MNQTKQRLVELRALMAASGVDAYLVPSTDPHGSEYVPACWQRRAFLSGFTGSAGDLVVTRDAAGLWTDGRYFLQAAAELKGSGIKLMKQGVKGTPEVAAWLCAELGRDGIVGADPELLTGRLEQELRAALGPSGLKLKLVAGNLVDRVWTDRPPPSKAPIELLPETITGEKVASKLRRVREALAAAGAHLHLLTQPDAIAWLFNIRGRDVEHNPVVIAYALVSADAAALYTDLDKATPELARVLGRSVELRPYAELGASLARLAKQRPRVWVDTRSANAWVLSRLGRSTLVDAPTPIALLKARKNATEIAGIREAHRRDGRAMVRFLAWLEGAVAKGRVSELSAGERLRAFRAEEERFRDESFAPIVGYRAHGAIIHYSATPESDAALAPEGILLVDSGGQYLDGTTDITRTILLGGEPTAEQRDRYTRVLKGHIAIARSRFPAGTAGRQLDAFARRALWDVGLNYNHGTGHGVGAYLSVHEGPQAISPTRCTGVPLDEGNLLSNEPGYYKEGEYGIRIENLVLTVRDPELSTEETTFLRFETVTLCPIETRLCDPALLDAGEREWLDRYHARVLEELGPVLGARTRRWLERATAPIA